MQRLKSSHLTPAPRLVSIPFKREGICKVKWVEEETEKAKSFNSLQAGRYMQRVVECLLLQAYHQGFNSLQAGRYMQSVTAEMNIMTSSRFQFPSSGKVYAKRQCRMFSVLGSASVSIPFKREGICKVEGDGNGIAIIKGFNSLQAGRYMQRIRTIWRSNHSLGFNSLQAGRYMQRPGPELRPKSSGTSFNSLQAGRYMQSVPILHPVGTWVCTP